MIWDNEEERILKKLWPRNDVTVEIIAEILKNRSPSAIRKHASEMGLKKEIKIDIDYKRLNEIELIEI